MAVSCSLHLLDKVVRMTESTSKIVESIANYDKSQLSLGYLFRFVFNYIESM